MRMFRRKKKKVSNRGQRAVAANNPSRVVLPALPAMRVNHGQDQGLKLGHSHAKNIPFELEDGDEEALGLQMELEQEVQTNKYRPSNKRTEYHVPASQAQVIENKIAQRQVSVNETGRKKVKHFSLRSKLEAKIAAQKAQKEAQVQTQSKQDSNKAQGMSTTGKVVAAAAVAGAAYLMLKE